MLFGENIIYLHNLHKLLCRHLTQFMSAFRRRSLPPVFPWGRVWLHVGYKRPYITDSLFSS